MAKQMKNIVTRRQNRHRSKSPQGIDISDMGGKRTRYEKYDTSPILGRSSFSKGGGFTSGYGAERGYGAGYRDRQVSCGLLINCCLAHPLCKHLGALNTQSCFNI